MVPGNDASTHRSSISASLECLEFDMEFKIENVSPLGFGCMRFDGRETNEIDIAHTRQMVKDYLDAGGNYFDTAWAYPNSEAALGEALQGLDYDRESYFICSKCVTWTHCESEDDLERQLQESLANLQTDYLDMYLMHNLGGRRTATFEKYHAWEFMKRAKERGLVRHIGFSAHCTPEELEESCEKFPEAEVVQLQINYLDWESPSFRERQCVEVARKHGKPVIAMEPVKGGLLANPSHAVREVLDEAFPNTGYAVDALLFAASMPGVFCTLSGMNALEQVRENAQAFKDFKPLSEQQLEAIGAVQRIMGETHTVQCTGCEYCAKVCPENVGISRSLEVLNYYKNFGDPYAANYQLGFVVRFNGGKNMITDCIRCGACEEACPQNLPILSYFDEIERDVLPFSQKVVLMKP
ncbi:4Fe-4S dicluster domain-containing protein [Eggerthellaceae bacterium zg-886]|uniref:4Fe-4S dicluster domain-containing protein n=2 Tax=Xiamenia xianingshaonis TaxID=2682776 RepID=A0ABX0IFR0_9ACTN|nr:4Fe-4S dicluster domain-containing protein [Xiamenia xianingshaonis]